VLLGAVMPDSTLTAWKEFFDGAGAYFGQGTRPLILDSWKRSRAAGVAATPAKTLLCKVDARDLEHRIARNASLLAVAMPILAAFSQSFGDLNHVVYLTDREGIVLYSVGNATEMLIQGLVPGYDWSERTMGTNGAGTALATGQPVAVIGPEHYQLPFHGAICLGAPIRDVNERLIGAIDFSTRVDRANPAQLSDIIRIAQEIEAALASACAVIATP